MPRNGKMSMGAPSSRRSESRSFGNIIETQEDVTPAVLAAMAQTPDDRLREIAAAFIRHIHAFAREVKLTEDEYDIGIDFLNRIGLSTLVCLLNNGNAGATETASALLGPFWRMNSPKTENGGSIVRSLTPGPELLVSGKVLDA